MVLLMGPIQTDHSLRCLRLINFFTRKELLVDFGKIILQHLTVPSLGRGSEAVHQAFAGEQKALPMAIEFLLG